MQLVSLLVAPYRTVHTCDVFSDLGWSTLAHIRKKAIMMHKIMNGNSPSYLSEMFEKQSGSTTYDLRSSDLNVQIPNVQTECYKKALQFLQLFFGTPYQMNLKRRNVYQNFRHKLIRNSALTTCKFAISL
jgi:hypothetical protein